jgi:hypothetical protein
LVYIFSGFAWIPFENGRQPLSAFKKGFLVVHDRKVVAQEYRIRLLSCGLGFESGISPACGGVSVPRWVGTWILRRGLSSDSPKEDEK